jgi:hypothetical protein
MAGLGYWLWWRVRNKENKIKDKTTSSDRTKQQEQIKKGYLLNYHDFTFYLLRCHHILLKYNDSDPNTTPTTSPNPEQVVVAF